MTIDSEEAGYPGGEGRGGSFRGSHNPAGRKENLDGQRRRMEGGSGGNARREFRGKLSNADDGRWKGNYFLGSRWVDPLIPGGSEPIGRVM